MVIICAHCGRSIKDRYSPCPGCGAVEMLREQPKPEWSRGEPFFYLGYIVWAIRHFLNDEIEWHFYKGITHMGTVRLTLERAKEILGIHHEADEGDFGAIVSILEEAECRV